MSRRVDAVVSGDKAGAPRESLSLSGAMVDTHNCAKAYEKDKITSDAHATSERINTIAEKSKQLRDDMEQYRKILAAKKAEVSQRRSDTESAQYELENRHAKELEAVQSGIKRMNRRRQLKQEDLIVGRYSLCKVAAKLAGLKRVKRARPDGSVKLYFSIGSNLPVYNLRSLHSKFGYPFVVTNH